MSVLMLVLAGCFDLNVPTACSENAAHCTSDATTDSADTSGDSSAADAEPAEARVCTPNEFVCSGPSNNELMKCSSDGLTLIPIATCPSAATCDAPMRRCTACAPGALSCTSKQVQQCDEFGTKLVDVGGPCPIGCAEGKCLSVREVAAGYQHTCALLSDNTVWCWGSNVQGQLGDGTTTDSKTPVMVKGLKDVTHISASFESTCARVVNEVYCWGGNSAGQLGDGTTTGRTTPGKVFGLSTAVGFECGFKHCCAIKSDKRIACWGDNSSGQLGDESKVQREKPVDISTLMNVDELALGGFHSCDREDGIVRCWGNNEMGQIGDGTTGLPVLLPKTVGSLSNVAAISLGATHSCALLKDQTAKCWGSGGNGRIGDGVAGSTPRTTPVAVKGLATLAQIEAFTYATCARNTGGSVWCWGSGFDETAPKAMTSWTTAKFLSGGGFHVCAILGEKLDRIECVGENDKGQLGDGSLTSAPTTPVTVKW
jgi:hypothetical protein